MQEWEDPLASISISDFLQRQEHNQPTVSVTSKELLPGHLHTHKPPYLLDLLSTFFSFPFFSTLPPLRREVLFREDVSLQLSPRHRLEGEEDNAFLASLIITGDCSRQFSAVFVCFSVSSPDTPGLTLLLVCYPSASIRVDFFRIPA